MSKDKNNSDVIFEQNFSLKARNSNSSEVSKELMSKKKDVVSQQKEGDEK